MSIEIFKDEKNKGKWVIRNGMFRTNCVVDRLSEQNLMGIYNKIGKILKIPDWKKEMEDEFPVSVSEKLVINELKKLTKNSEEIKKLKEQIEKRNGKR